MSIFFFCGCATPLPGDAFQVVSKYSELTLTSAGVSTELGARGWWLTGKVWEVGCAPYPGHEWIRLSRLQNWLLLLETPADLASAIDTVFIARHKELRSATARTIPIIAFHSLIFLSSTRGNIAGPQMGSSIVMGWTVLFELPRLSLCIFYLKSIGGCFF